MSDKAYQVVNGDLVTMGLLSSKMHLVWLKIISGKLKSDYSYSNRMVYNTFTLPDDIDNIRIEEAVKNIIETRTKYFTQGANLADLYDPILMPADLRKSHQQLDKVVDALYGLENPTDEERVAILMKLYQDKTKMQ